MVQENEERFRALESEVNQLKHLVRLKDEDLQSLRETNKALVNQTRSKWTVVQALTILLAFFFALAFGYEVAEVIEVRHLVREVTNALDRIDESISVIRATAHVVPLLASGYNNHSDRKFGRGGVDADEAIAWVDEFRSDISDSSLRKSMGSLRSGCLVLQARCAYLGGEFEKLHRSAEELISLDSDAWEGYHFRGLCRFEHYYDADGATEDYKRSLDIRRSFNPDAFNLTELKFAVGKFEDAIQAADQYLVDFPKDCRAITGGRFPSQLPSLAWMYRSVARVLTGQEGARSKLSEELKLFRESKVDMQTQFGPSALIRFMEGLPSCREFLTLQRNDRELVWDAMVEMVKTNPGAWKESSPAPWQ